MRETRLRVTLKLKPLSEKADPGRSRLEDEVDLKCCSPTQGCSHFKFIQNVA